MLPKPPPHGDPSKFSFPEVSAVVIQADRAAPFVTVSTLVAPDDAAIIRERAAAAERSIAAEIRVALRPYLQSARATSPTERSA